MSPNHTLPLPLHLPARHVGWWEERRGEQPSPRCALRAIFGQCHGIGVAILSTSPPPVALGSRKKLSVSISALQSRNGQVPAGKTYRFLGGLGRRKNSARTRRILARRKGVLGVVLRALHDDGANHTRIQYSEISFFWPPPGHARGGWREAHGRCARGEGVAWSLQRTLPQTI